MQLTHLTACRQHGCNIFNISRMMVGMYVRLCSSKLHGHLTLSPSIPLRLFTLPYWTNPQFWLRHSGAVALSSEHQRARMSKIKTGGLDHQYGAERFNNYSLEQLTLKGLKYRTWTLSNLSLFILLAKLRQTLFYVCTHSLFRYQMQQKHNTCMRTQIQITNAKANSNRKQ